MGTLHLQGLFYLFVVVDYLFVSVRTHTAHTPHTSAHTPAHPHTHTHGHVHTRPNARGARRRC
jgi:hypothetical protein